MICKGCGSDLGNPERVGRRETCPSCGADLHTCRNCAFFEPGSYNDCREPNAERVLDKARSNFCEYFSPPRVSGKNAKTTARSVREELDGLFGGGKTKK